MGPEIYDGFSSIFIVIFGFVISPGFAVIMLVSRTEKVWFSFCGWILISPDFKCVEAKRCWLFDLGD